MTINRKQKTVIWVGVALMIGAIATQAEAFPKKAKPRPEPERISDEYYAGFISGESLASNIYSGGGWLTGGFTIGLITNVLGLITYFVIAEVGDVLPPPEHRIRIGPESIDYRVGFMEGYSVKAKQKRTDNLMFGGLIGAAINTYIWLKIFDVI